MCEVRKDGIKCKLVPIVNRSKPCEGCEFVENNGCAIELEHINKCGDYTIWVKDEGE